MKRFEGQLQESLKGFKGIQGLDGRLRGLEGRLEGLEEDLKGLKGAEKEVKRRSLRLKGAGRFRKRGLEGGLEVSCF